MSRGEFQLRMGLTLTTLLLGTNSFCPVGNTYTITGGPKLTSDPARLGFVLTRSRALVDTPSWPQAMDSLIPQRHQRINFYCPACWYVARSNSDRPKYRGDTDESDRIERCQLEQHFLEISRQCHSAGKSEN